MRPEVTRPALLRLGDHEVSGLRWLRECPRRQRRTNEPEILRALVDVERAAARLLKG
jgi:hypothetical protein